MTNPAFQFFDPKFNPFMDIKNYGLNGDAPQKFFEFFSFKTSDDGFFNDTIAFQKKNYEALTELTKAVNGNMQSILNHQIELGLKLASETQALAKDLMENGQPEDKLNRSMEIIKAQLDQQTKALKDVTAMIYKTNDEASDIIKTRMNAAVKEMEKTLETLKAAKPATTATARTTTTTTKK